MAARTRARKLEAAARPSSSPSAAPRRADASTAAGDATAWAPSARRSPAIATRGSTSRATRPSSTSWRRWWARDGARLIVSHHDFARTPPLATLLDIVDAATRTRAPSPRSRPRYATAEDRDTLFELLAQRPERTSVIGMGASADLRIELAARGSLLAYGYLETPTAPGQLSAAETHARLLAASPAYAARRAPAI